MIIRALVKGTLNTASGVGVGMLMHEGVVKLIPEAAGTATKVCCYTAETMVGAATNWYVSKYINELVDECAEGIGMLFMMKGKKEDKNEEENK